MFGQSILESNRAYRRLCSYSESSTDHPTTPIQHRPTQARPTRCEFEPPNQRPIELVSHEQVHHELAITPKFTDVETGKTVLTA